MTLSTFQRGPASMSVEGAMRMLRFRSSFQRRECRCVLEQGSQPRNPALVAVPEKNSRPSPESGAWAMSTGSHASGLVAGYRAALRPCWPRPRLCTSTVAQAPGTPDPSGDSAWQHHAGSGYWGFVGGSSLCLAVATWGPLSTGLFSSRAAPHPCTLG